MASLHLPWRGRPAVGRKRKLDVAGGLRAALLSDLSGLREAWLASRPHTFQSLADLWRIRRLSLIHHAVPKRVDPRRALQLAYALLVQPGADKFELLALFLLHETQLLAPREPVRLDVAAYGRVCDVAAREPEVWDVLAVLWRKGGVCLAAYAGAASLDAAAAAAAAATERGSIVEAEAEAEEAMARAAERLRQAMRRVVDLGQGEEARRGLERSLGRRLWRVEAAADESDEDEESDLEEAAPGDGLAAGLLLASDSDKEDEAEVKEATVEAESASMATLELGFGSDEEEGQALEAAMDPFFETEGAARSAAAMETDAELDALLNLDLGEETMNQAEADAAARRDEAAAKQAAVRREREAARVRAVQAKARRQGAALGTERRTLDDRRRQHAQHLARIRSRIDGIQAERKEAAPTPLENRGNTRRRIEPQPRPRPRPPSSEALRRPAEAGFEALAGDNIGLSDRDEAVGEGDAAGMDLERPDVVAVAGTAEPTTAMALLDSSDDDAEALAQVSPQPGAMATLRADAMPFAPVAAESKGAAPEERTSKEAAPKLRGSAKKRGDAKPRAAATKPRGAKRKKQRKTADDDQALLDRLLHNTSLLAKYL